VNSTCALMNSCRSLMIAVRVKIKVYPAGILVGQHRATFSDENQSKG
jgi:hypothetical protein